MSTSVRMCEDCTRHLVCMDGHCQTRTCDVCTAYTRGLIVTTWMLPPGRRQGRVHYSEGCVYRYIYLSGSK